MPCWIIPRRIPKPLSSISKSSSVIPDWSVLNSRNFPVQPTEKAASPASIYKYVFSSSSSLLLLKFTCQSKAQTAGGRHTEHFNSLIVIACRKYQIGIERRFLVQKTKVAGYKRKLQVFQTIRFLYPFSGEAITSDTSRRRRLVASYI